MRVPVTKTIIKKPLAITPPKPAKKTRKVLVKKEKPDDVDKARVLTEKYNVVQPQISVVNSASGTEEEKCIFALNDSIS